MDLTTREMKTNRIAVGLDIGTTKIVALIGRHNEFGKIEIIGHGTAPSLGVQRGVVVNITQTIESIEKAVELAEQSAGLSIKSVAVGIAGQHIRSLQHSDYITREDAEEVIEDADLDRLTENVHKLAMMPGEEIIHVLPQEYKVDGQGDIKEPRGMYGGRLEASFHIVVGQLTSIKNIARCVKSANLDLHTVNLEPLASADAVLSQEEKEAGVVLVDIGGGTTDVAIFKDGIIRHTAVIPHGGNIITSDIKEGCSIIEKQAETLKVRFGSAWPGENKENEIVAIPWPARSRAQRNQLEKPQPHHPCALHGNHQRRLYRNQELRLRPTLQEAHRRRSHHGWWQPAEAHQAVGGVLDGFGHARGLPQRAPRFFGSHQPLEFAHLRHGGRSIDARLDQPQSH